MRGEFSSRVFSVSFFRYSFYSLLAVGSGTAFSNTSEKCLAALVGPFSAAYFLMSALSCGV